MVVATSKSAISTFWPLPSRVRAANAATHRIARHHAGRDIHDGRTRSKWASRSSNPFTAMKPLSAWDDRIKARPVLERTFPGHTPRWSSRMSRGLSVGHRSYERPNRSMMPVEKFSTRTSALASRSRTTCRPAGCREINCDARCFGWPDERAAFAGDLRLKRPHGVAARRRILDLHDVSAQIAQDQRANRDPAIKCVKSITRRPSSAGLLRCVASVLIAYSFAASIVIARVMLALSTVLRHFGTSSAMSFASSSG